MTSTIVEKTSKAVRQLPPRSNNTLVGIALAIAVLAAGAFVAWRVTRGDDRPAIDAGQVATPDAAILKIVPPADVAEVVPDAGEGEDAAAGSGSDIEIEMEPDPVTAKNLAPKESDAEDEAPDAPATEADVEKHTPPAPVLAKNTEEAVRFIKDGKSELALSSLRALWKKAPKSGYIPFLLGNLYFDKSWWSIAMDHYRIAITKNGGYKQNAILNRNIIRMLASTKTRGKADFFLRKTIGKSAVPYLKQAQVSEKNAAVRQYAAGLAKAIGGR